jgi:hypothetical protein
VLPKFSTPLAEPAFDVARITCIARPAADAPNVFRSAFPSQLSHGDAIGGV